MLRVIVITIIFIIMNYIIELKFYFEINLNAASAQLYLCSIQFNTKKNSFSNIQSLVCIAFDAEEALSNDRRT